MNQTRLQTSQKIPTQISFFFAFYPPRTLVSSSFCCSYILVLRFTVSPCSVSQLLFGINQSFSSVTLRVEVREEEIVRDE